MPEKKDSKKNIIYSLLFLNFQKKQTPTLEVGGGMLYFPYQTSK